MRRLLRVLGAVLVAGLLAALAPTGYALAASAGRIATAGDVASQPVAIVFGAGLSRNGTPLPYLRARLDLARQLYEDGSVRVVLVSGDNRRANYNEPDAMREYLVDSGLPADKVVADYAGFDTYSTCIRAQRIFGVEAAILVSQSYHLPRAVATCRSVGVDAWGVGDSSAASFSEEWWPDVAREWPANVKMAWDLLSRRQPVLGKVETSVTDALKS